MKKRVLMLIVLMSIALVLTGCSILTNILDPLPEEYVDGLRLSRDYPEDDFELYDDAVVFEQEEDDEEISLLYGTEDDIDDVIDYYEDLFDDNQLTVDESEDDKDEFYAKGSGDGFLFEITVEEAKGKYEERAFATVVEVNIEFYTVGQENLEKMQGFWLACGFDGAIGDTTRMEGVALDFGDMVVTVYTGFEVIGSNLPLTVVDDDTFKYTLEGTEIVFDVTFETVDGLNVLSFDNGATVIHFEPSSYTDMLVYEDMGGEEGGMVYLTDDLTDEDLEYWLTDIDWYLTYEKSADGQYTDTTFYNRMLFNWIDYTGEDEYANGEFYYITWYIEDSMLYIYYDDGTYYQYFIDFEFDGVYGYLYLLDPDYGWNEYGYVYTDMMPVS